MPQRQSDGSPTSGGNRGIGGEAMKPRKTPPTEGLVGITMHVLLASSIFFLVPVANCEDESVFSHRDTYLSEHARVSKALHSNSSGLESSLEAGGMGRWILQVSHTDIQTVQRQLEPKLRWGADLISQLG